MNVTKITQSPFGTLLDGTVVDSYTLSRGSVSINVSGYGARLTSIRVPDRSGASGEVILGHDSLEPYLSDKKTFMGAVVGRFGNRIAGGRFTIDGETFQIPLNDGPNALHGGPSGFDQKLWSAEATENAVTFTLVSPDGDMGFPGRLTVSAKYSLADENTVVIDYTAITDKPTVVNVTNHAYFNLAGEDSDSILDHELTLFAEAFTPVDANLIPTGELASVTGTPFDFLAATPIGERIDAHDVQLERARGYDHNWVYGAKGVTKTTAKLKDPASGRVLIVETTEPGMQFYAGNFLDGSVPTRNGQGTVGFRSGLCLETQGYPDACNQPEFPSVVLCPGETLMSRTSFRFSVEP